MVEKMGAHQFRSEPVRVCRVIWWDHDARAAGFAPGPLLWNSVCAFDVCGFGKEGTICFAFKLLVMTTSDGDLPMPRRVMFAWF
jgi:hypothetical protein